MKTTTEKILSIRSLYVFQPDSTAQALLGAFDAKALARQIKKLKGITVVATNPETGISGFVKEGSHSVGPANWKTRKEAIEASWKFALHWPGIKFSVQQEDLTWKEVVKPTSLFQVLAP